MAKHNDNSESGPVSFMREMTEADGIGRVGPPGHGDFMNVWIKVRNDHIADISFVCHDCDSARAGAEAMCGMVLGMHLDDAAEVTGELVVNRSGALGQKTVSCADLGATALYNAIVNHVFRSISTQ